jgi:predicted amidohydrolase
VQILCFPECATTGFDWLKDPREVERVYAEPVPGPLVERFAAKAHETDMYIIMGMVERPPGTKTLYNTAFLVGPQEGYMGRHRKVLAESVFAPGTEAEVFDTRYGKIGMFICADMRSPELARLLALRGACLLFQPTNYFHADAADGADARRRYLGKRTAQRARAMDNGLPLVIANAGRAQYVNNSRILGPDAQGPEPVLACATRKEQLLIADVGVDLGENRATAAARRAPWLFEALAQEMLAAAGAPQPVTAGTPEVAPGRSASTPS